MPTTAKQLQTFLTGQGSPKAAKVAPAEGDNSLIVSDKPRGSNLIGCGHHAIWSFEGKIYIGEQRLLSDSFTILRAFTSRVRDKMDEALTWRARIGARRLGSGTNVN